jgi:plasmid stabilization system protein ParE
MDYQVLIADTALADLREIVEFIAQDDAGAAGRFGQRLVDRALSLGWQPGRFPFHDRLRGIRKMPLRPYLIFYVCDESANTVSIIHFWHGARRSPDFFTAS